MRGGVQLEEPAEDDGKGETGAQAFGLVHIAQFGRCSRLSLVRLPGWGWLRRRPVLSKLALPRGLGSA